MKKILLSIILFLAPFHVYSQPESDRYRCIIVGDSIALGLGLATDKCKTLTRSGITSKRWFELFQHNPFYRDTLYKTAIISLSVNDLTTTDTAEYLYNTRKWLRGDKVFWILPSQTLKPTQYDIIINTAKEFQDTVVNITDFTSRGDGIHPASLHHYKEIVEYILSK